MGTPQVPILCVSTFLRLMRSMNELFVHLGVGDTWLSVGNHGGVVFVEYYPYLATGATFKKRSEKPIGPTPHE